MSWASLATAQFVAWSVALFGSGPWWALAVPLVVATVVSVVAAAKLRSVWPHITNMTRVVGLCAVVSVAVFFTAGMVSQTTLDGRPLLDGTVEAVSVERVNDFASVLPGLVSDTQMATWADEDVRTRQGLLVDAANRWQLSSQQLAASATPDPTADVTQKMVAAQDLSGRVLTTRVELANQPSPGRSSAFNAAVAQWEQAMVELFDAMDATADDLGFPVSGRTWEVLDPGEESR
jgi:hypothetical protein